MSDCNTKVFFSGNSLFIEVKNRWKENAIFAKVTTAELNNFLSNPGTIDQEDLKVIQEYREKYPYSPLFAALYAKALHNLKDLEYDGALRDAAIIMPDRSVLYHLIYKEPLKEKISSVEVGLNETAEQPERPDQQDVLHEESIAEEITEIIDQDTQELEQDILVEAINTTIQMDVDQLLEEEVSDSIEDWKEAASEEKVIEEQKQSTHPAKFSDWLFAMKDANDKQQDKTNKEEQLLSSKELIDRFIKTKPRKIDISKDPVTPQEMGKLSLVEDQGFVTETLAEIYAKQGKYQKAIKIYEQLSLNNPEKKVFFASRIRFLREKLEYDK